MRLSRYWCLVLLLLVPTPVRAADKSDKPARPNIVIIMADDMGFSDLGCYGSEIATPSIDGMAARGLRFTQFYNTARCCPTRASLLTGLYPHQAGVGHMVQDKGRPGYMGRLNNRCATIAELLRIAGYRTYISGKWHVGEDKGHWPVDRGFERSYSLVSGGTNYFRLDPERTLVLNDKRITPPAKWYITDAITDNALTFLKEHKNDKPFFLYLPYTSPHWPLHAHPEDIKKYRGKYKMGWDVLRTQRHERMKKLGIVDGKWPLTPRDPSVPAWDKAKNQDDMDLRMAVYAAQIECMDRNIGRILAQLKAMGAEENTLVVFLADNGGCAEIIDRGKPGVPAGEADSFLSYGVGWANASNTPFRLYKHWVHEGGVSSPLVVRWPLVIVKSGITHQPGHLIDLMATALDVAGARYPAMLGDRQLVPMEGQSLLPILQGRTRTGHEAIYWEHEGNRAVRQGKWKIVARFRGDWELYDMDADRTEMNNLATKEPERVRTMTGLYDAWAKRANVVDWGTFTKAKAKKKE